MKINSLVVILSLVLLAACSDKKDRAATLICECNSGLIAHNQKIKAFQAENNVSEILALEEEGKKITEKSAECLKKMEQEIGRKLMNDEAFELEVLPILQERCPEVYNAYRKINALD